LPRALLKLTLELGVTVRTSCGVREILVDEGGVSGAVTDDGETVELAAVVSNADAESTYSRLLEGTITPSSGRKWPERACSGVVLYLGLDHLPDHLLHHNFVFSRDPEEEFDAIYRKGEPAPDPTCYVCAPARTDAGVAPDGCESLYVLVHTPYLRPGRDWAQTWPDYRSTVMRKLETTGGLQDLESHIRLERYLTPADIARRYAAPSGAIYGFASHGRMTGALKPSNRRADLRGLYLAGGSAHPGPGMPMVMMSGWIAADALDNDGVARKAP
jgi:phytoene desaturase